MVALVCVKTGGGWRHVRRRTRSYRDSTAILPPFGQVHDTFLDEESNNRARKKGQRYEFHPDARILEGRGDTGTIPQHERDCHAEDFERGPVLGSCSGPAENGAGERDCT